MDEAMKAALPSLPVRLLKVFGSPGDLFRRLRDDPRWFGALLAGALLVAMTMALVPADLWVQVMRERAAAQGGEVPAALVSMGPLIRAGTVLSTLVFYFLWAFLLAGIVTFVFAFLFGDQGSYRQYLAVVAHGLFITAVGGALLFPLRVMQGDPELTLNVGTFFLFLDEGYLFRSLKLLDLWGLWGYAVMAVGVAETDPRRNLGFPLAFFMAFAVAFAFLFGIFGG